MHIRETEYSLIMHHLLSFAFAFLYRRRVTGTPMKEGPGLLVSAHLTALDPLLIGVSSRYRHKPIFKRDKLVKIGVPPKFDITQLLSLAFGGVASNSPTFEEDLRGCFDRGASLLAFPENNPGAVKRKFSNHRHLSPRDVPVQMGRLAIFNMVQNYESRKTNESVRTKVGFQPVGIRYNEIIRYFPGTTFPLAADVDVRFDKIQYLDGQPIEDFANGVMMRIADLSGRDYDDRLYRRLRRHSRTSQ
jgi:hypothetical protein